MLETLSASTHEHGITQHFRNVRCAYTQKLPALLMSTALGTHKEHAVHTPKASLGTEKNTEGIILDSVYTTQCMHYR